MLFTAALSFFLGLGASLATASPISNATALRRGCGFRPSDKFIDEAEAHFEKHKIVVNLKAGLKRATTSIPVYCAPHFFLLSFRRDGADAGLFYRACDLQDHIHF